MCDTWQVHTLGAICVSYGSYVRILSEDYGNEIAMQSSSQSEKKTLCLVNSPFLLSLFFKTSNFADVDLHFFPFYFTFEGVIDWLNRKILVV